MKNILTEELDKILYLTTYKRGVVISEQETPSQIFNLSGYDLKIVNSKISLRTKNGMTPMNGIVDEFKVNPNTGQIIDPDFVVNDEFVNHIFSFIPNDLKPIQTQTKYKFVGIIPKGFPGEGTIRVYTADITNENIGVLEEQGIVKSKDGTISPKTYINKKGERGVGTYIRLYPGGKNIPALTTKSTELKPTSKEFIELNLESPFEFDSTSLTPESDIKFKEFIEKMKNNYADITGNVEIISSSSIDGDPNETIKGGIKRFDYDKQLSDKRAQSIVDILKKYLPDTKLNFVPKGIGQTDKFAPGKKYPEVKNQKETSPNRRLIIRLPKVEKTI